MLALTFGRTGDLSALELLEVPAPEPKPGEVVVRIVAAGLNPSDVKNVRGSFPYTTVPRIAGRDFAGIVARGPADFVGAAVWGTGGELGFTRDGTHAEYVALPLEGVSRKPDALGFEQAASVGVPYTTAWSALERCDVSAGDRVVVIGATGAVGAAAMDLAAWRGAHVVGVVRRHEQRLALEAKGRQGVTVERPAALADAVLRIFEDGANVIVDTTGAYLDAAVHALAAEGRVAVITAADGGTVALPVRSLYRRGGVVVGINSLLYDSVTCAKVLDRIGAGFTLGALPAPSGFTVTPLSGAVAAYRDVAAGGAGKRVLVMAR